MPQGGGATISSGSSGAGAGSASAELFREVRSGTSWSGNERNTCFLSSGSKVSSGGGFVDVSGASGFDFPDDGRGMTPVDWDGDGDLDIITSNRNAPQIRFLRNDVPSTSKHWLGIHLEGTGKINRDAVGARVTVTLDGAPSIIRTLRAGEGFQAQNSKWLHFGLGKSTQISSVTVAWPGGETQSYSDIQVDRRYRLICGEPTGKAENPRTITWPTPLPKIEARRFTGGQANTPSRLPLSVLPYTQMDGQRTSITPTKSKRLKLINLWASWCPPCVKELKEFAKEKERLEQSGLEVIALSLDGVGQRAGDAKAAEKFMKALGDPFVSGIATPESLEKISILHDLIYEKRSAVALPTSLLIDQNGRLAGYYEGGMDVETLLSRVEIANEEDSQAAMNNSLPFAGRWLARPIGFLLTEYGNALMKRGLTDDAVWLWNRFKREFEIDPSAANFAVKLGTVVEKQGSPVEALQFFEYAVRLTPNNATARASLAAKYMQAKLFPLAIDSYRAAVKLDPSLVNARYNLAILLNRSGDTAEAMAGFRAVVEKAPDHALAHANISAILMKNNDLNGSIKHLQLALKAKPDFAAVRFQLAKLLEATGKSKDAIAQYELLLKQNADFKPAADRLKVLQAKPSDGE